MQDEQAIRDALEVFGEKKREFIALLLKDADTFVDAIGQALEEGKAQAAGDAAHALKSIMRQIEARSVAENAFGIEQDGRAGNMAGCRAGWSSLKEGYAAVRECLEKLSLQV